VKRSRELTRSQRYEKKLKKAEFLPLEICTVNFEVDQNLGFLIRAAACFGVRKINVIGSIPDSSILKPLSGSLQNYVELQGFSNPHKYVEYVEKTNMPIVAAEISDSATSIFGFNFTLSGNFHLVVGNERSGVPEEISLRATTVFVPMPGVGYCLNTSQAANIFLYEIYKQFNNIKNESL